MTACDRCGTDGTFLYTCPDCGDHFCDEHRDPDAHECASPSDDPAAEDQDLGAETVEVTVPDEGPDAADEETTDPEPTTSTEAVQDGDGDSTDPSEDGGGLRGIPVLGRLFG